MSNAAASADKRFQEACMKAMSGWPNARCKEWFIWASKKRPCPQCKSQPDVRCYHLGKLKNDIYEGVQWPHDTRVDWPKMYEGLKRRGYIED